MSLNAQTICWIAAAALSLSGLVLATYLSITYLSGEPASCGAGGCGAVTTSEYARFLGVPVALLGVAGYAALLLGSLALLGIPDPPPVLRWALAAVALLGFAFSVYLTSTQALLIGSYCVFCLTSAALMTALMLLTFAAAPRRQSLD